MTLKVAFLGLGVMGYPMAAHLVRAGHRVTAYNRTAPKAERWAAETGAAHAATPADAARGCDLVMACVGADADVRAVCTGADGAFAAMAEGAVFVDHTTTSAALAREMAEAAAERGLGFVDAPVSGGQAGAEAGQLTIMCGGDQGAFDTAEPALAAYGKRVRRLGDAGAGQTAKMVNQVCIAGIVQGLSEALHLCQSAGLDADAVVDVIGQGAAQSWQMDNRAHTMVRGEFDFGFAVDWMRKDLGIVLDEARRLGISLPLTALVDQFYADVQAMGGHRQDTSSLIRRFRG
ncbi:3-hydroxyisobutyrate dehydrogenase [Rhodothalassium salexigens DSM 2132]|uniref:3-hydroxyisobutyrate dehydrogenase n=1 Tax=Rhodothalassium salexigens DSM 2132 TaxID=1188247 RepID=A0A4R2PRS7_RHOSA|nr:NAD(P)-dependent oxidoreductase [Rhodothalassium salexigens]MBB4210283.1 3-hydroxyisobutyrate dehydrogenase-like beta-hydroxyacid dehydrogenase [Rhodothalassium salexigens DSM 2132]MBK1638803.1 oxidoreductase [Rhodothalassium salexigens DSM 2132]TCP38447.1 3-hydroxyisobutyrate dehydrogenase [Rhodothalassium salexigens DSM 2132]